MWCNVIAMLPLSCDVQSVLLSGDSKLFSFSGSTMKKFWIKIFYATWPRLVGGIISVGVSCTVNWQLPRVSAPAARESPWETRKREAWPRKLTLPNMITKFLPFGAVWISTLQSCLSCIHICHPVHSSLSHSNILLSTSLVVFGWEEFASASAVTWGAYTPAESSRVRSSPVIITKTRQWLFGLFSMATAAVRTHQQSQVESSHTSLAGSRVLMPHVLFSSVRL